MTLRKDTILALTIAVQKLNSHSTQQNNVPLQVVSLSFQHLLEVFSGVVLLQKTPQEIQFLKSCPLQLRKLFPNYQRRLVNSLQNSTSNLKFETTQHKTEKHMTREQEPRDLNHKIRIRQRPKLKPVQQIFSNSPLRVVSYP